MGTRNIYWEGKGGRCLGMTNLLPSCADSLEIWKPKPPETRKTCTGIAFTFEAFYVNLFFLLVS
jgi:hypothetical protein